MHPHHERVEPPERPGCFQSFSHLGGKSTEDKAMVVDILVLGDHDVGHRMSSCVGEKAISFDYDVYVLLLCPTPRVINFKASFPLCIFRVSLELSTMPEFDPESEYRPLLPPGDQPKGIKKHLQSLNPRKIVAIIITVAFLVATFVLLGLYKHSYKLSDDPLEAAHQILGRHPAFVS